MGMGKVRGSPIKPHNLTGRCQVGQGDARHSEEWLSGLLKHYRSQLHGVAEAGQCIAARGASGNGSVDSTKTPWIYVSARQGEAVHTIHLSGIETQLVMDGGRLIFRPTKAKEAGL